MRGKVFRLLWLYHSMRITPAYAGKSATLSPAWAAAVGSPPHMRGKATYEDTGKIVAGITPAYAGKSSVNGWPSFAIRDHPRICGEK